MSNRDLTRIEVAPTTPSILTNDKQQNEMKQVLSPRTQNDDEADHERDPEKHHSGKYNESESLSNIISGRSQKTISGK